MTALSLSIQMAVMMLIGYIARKRHIVDEHFSRSLGSFIFAVVFPCLIIKSMQIEQDPEDLSNMWILMVISLVTMGLMFLLSLIVNGLMRNNRQLSKIVCITLMFTNYTYMAFPVMASLFQERGLLFISVYTIPVRILFFVLTPLILTFHNNQNEEKIARRLLRDTARATISPPILAVVVGIIFYLFGVRLPEVIDSVIDMIARTATPLGMVLCGLALANLPMNRIWTNVRVYVLTLIRLIVAPAIIFGLYLLIRPYITIDPLVAKIAILYTALPSVASVIVFAIETKQDVDSAAQIVFLSTVLSILTLPVWAFFLSYLI